jgi:hypothetical protein
MTAIDFPNTPSVNDEFTAGDITYVWSGTVWNSIGQAVTGPAGEQGPIGPEGPAGPAGPAGSDANTDELYALTLMGAV